MSELVPGIKIVRRPLQIFFLVDKSTSTSGPKINAINQGIPAAIQAVDKALKQHPEVEGFIRVITFSSTVNWHIGPEPVSISNMVWTDIVAGGKTRTGLAVNLLCDSLELNALGSRNFPPVCILISDGFHTDSERSYDEAMARLNKVPWGVKAIRLVLAIGKPGEDYDQEKLEMFGNQPNAKILKITDYREIVRYIRWASVAATESATRSKSSGERGEGITNVEFPALPDSAEVW